MTEQELSQFLLSFDGVESRVDEEKNITLFEISFIELEKIWQVRVKQDIGDFELSSGLKILNKAEIAGDQKAIFAILHNNSNPVRVEMKTGRQLAKLLRGKYESVVPSKLMNESEWNTVIGFGQIQPSEVIDFLRLSYRLVSEQ